MDKTISNNIVEVCKQLGIDYKSCNPNYVMFTNDAQRLVQLYKDILDIESKLQEIADRHDIPELKELLQVDVETLSVINHGLIKLANKIREEEKC